MFSRGCKTQFFATIPRVLKFCSFLRNYAIGEKYVEHHDMNNISDNDHACGPRIYTFFLYLSDVEEGGETRLGPRSTVQGSKQLEAGSVVYR